jgi:hypothetical protein
MALVFHHRLAKPVWAIAFFTVALAASPSATPFLIPPTTLFVIAALGIALIVFTKPDAVPRLHTSRSRVRVLPPGDGGKTTAAISMATGTRVHMLDEPNRRTDDALDLARMDDDGGCRGSTTRSPA